jgi:hypothetical protein
MSFYHKHIATSSDNESSDNDFLDSSSDDNITKKEATKPITPSNRKKKHLDSEVQAAILNSILDPKKPFKEICKSDPETFGPAKSVKRRAVTNRRNYLLSLQKDPERFSKACIKYGVINRSSRDKQKHQHTPESKTKSKY